ncbi:hypothetical protein AMK19_31280 [Kitasatospora sp. CB01950]|nr:hypothetical protein AMK19_31280 [Kitasatospora sp. CB01950]
MGALVPGVGTVQLILDRNTHAFLGERVVGEAGSETEGRVKSNSAVRTFAIVDRADQLPS